MYGLPLAAYEKETINQKHIETGVTYFGQQTSSSPKGLEKPHRSRVSELVSQSCFFAHTLLSWQSFPSGSYKIYFRISQIYGEIVQLTYYILYAMCPTAAGIVEKSGQQSQKSQLCVLHVRVSALNLALRTNQTLPSG